MHQAQNEMRNEMVGQIMKWKWNAPGTEWNEKWNGQAINEIKMKRTRHGMKWGMKWLGKWNENEMHQAQNEMRKKMHQAQNETRNEMARQIMKWKWNAPGTEWNEEENAPGTEWNEERNG